MGKKRKTEKYRLFTYNNMIVDLANMPNNEVIETEQVIQVADDATEKELLSQIFFKSKRYEIDDRRHDDHAIFFRTKEDWLPVCEIRKVAVTK